MANALFQPLETYQDYATRTTQDRNALARQQQQLTQADQAFQWEQQDRTAQAEAAKGKAQQAAIEWGVNAVGVLAPLKDRPDEFNRVADVFAAEAAQRGIPLRREEITPENVAAIEAQLRVRGGMAPPAAPKPDIREVGDALVDVTGGQANELYRAPPKPGEGYTLTPGARRYDAAGKLIASVPVAPRQPQERYRQLSPQEAEQMGLPPGSYQMAPNGQIDVIGGPANRAKPTVDQLKVADYATRMDRAESGIGTFTPSGSDYVAANTAMERGTLIGAGANSAVSKEGQKFYNAAAAWVRAKLRHESGAAIGAQEMAQEIKTFFPVPSDSPEVIAQKAEMRRQVVEGMAAQAGPAAPKLIERAPVGAPAASGGWGKAVEVGR